MKKKKTTFRGVNFFLILEKKVPRVVSSDPDPRVPGAAAGAAAPPLSSQRRHSDVGEG